MAATLLNCEQRRKKDGNDNRDDGDKRFHQITREPFETLSSQSSFPTLYPNAPTTPLLVYLKPDGI